MYLFDINNYNKRVSFSVIGIWEVAREKNDRHHRTINTTPYNLLYGQHPRVNISDLNFDQTLLKQLSSQADLEKLLGAGIVDTEEEIIEVNDDEPDVFFEVPPDVIVLNDTEEEENHSEANSVLDTNTQVEVVHTFSPNAGGFIREMDLTDALPSQDDFLPLNPEDIEGIKKLICYKICTFNNVIMEFYCLFR
jgi:hypothetical protein